MEINEIIGICQYAIKKAVESGADEAEAYASIGRETEVNIETNDLKMGKSHVHFGLGVRVFSNYGLGFASVNSKNTDKVMETVSKAVKISSNTPSDRCNTLPQATKIQEVSGLYDTASEEFKVDNALKMALKMLKEAREYDPRISVDSGHFNAAVENRIIVNSNGVQQQEKSSLFTWFIMGMAVDGEEVSNFDFQFDGTRQLENVDVLKTAKDFARNAVGSLGAKKVKSFKGSVILSPESTLELLVQPIIFSLDSNNVQKGLSIFKSKFNSEIASQELTLFDDGTIPGGLGSSDFDREGLPHEPLTLINKGIFKAGLYNTYTALKDGKNSTGHAAGDTRSSPSIAPTNLVMAGGKEAKEDLTRETQQGIIVTRFSGNINPISGDFSGVVKGGYYVERGQIKHPVRETMVAGNAFTLLKNISAVSKERKKIFNCLLPYVKLEGLSVTGG